MALKIRTKPGYQIVVDQLACDQSFAPLSSSCIKRVGFHLDGCQGVIYSAQDNGDIRIFCGKWDMNGCQLEFIVPRSVDTPAKLKDHLESKT